MWIYVSTNTYSLNFPTLDINGQNSYIPKYTFKSYMPIYVFVFI